jgi:hypothetical protein
MSDIPLSEFGIDAITQKMILALKQVASAMNKSTIITYTNTINSIKDQNLWNQSMGRPLIPIPPPPMLKIVNEALVTANEQGVGEKDWSQVFFDVPYVPIVAPPPPAPAVVIGTEELYYPGFFTTTAGDSPDVGIGSVVTQGGHSYKKTVIGHSPFAPNGNVTAWQQIS